jgi:hypothetical protein
MGDPPGLATGAPYEDSTVLAEPLAFETFETEARTLFRRLCIVKRDDRRAGTRNSPAAPMNAHPRHQPLHPREQLLARPLQGDEVVLRGGVPTASPWRRRTRPRSCPRRRRDNHRGRTAAQPSRRSAPRPPNPAASSSWHSPLPLRPRTRQPAPDDLGLTGTPGRPFLRKTVSRRCRALRWALGRSCMEDVGDAACD